MLAKFWGAVSETTVAKLRKRKEKFLYEFTYSIKRARFMAVMQRRLRNVQKSVMHM